jgi:2-polyprenyl-3-methyl-5-hydroxy-6-metoxy-1,4-benzoquinol methylase
VGGNVGVWGRGETVKRIWSRLFPMIRAGFLAFSLCVFSAPAIPQAAAQAQSKPSLTDEELWNWYEKWVAGLKPLPPGKSMTTSDALVSEGMAREEASARYRRINVLRQGSVDRERIYWNAAFKLGGGPSAPLRLLQEALKNVKPGMALDAAMGRGRNAVYLAASGWQTYGYDMAGDALTAAQAAATEAKVKINTVQAKHEEFDFGESKWDLILCSYCYIAAEDPRWAAVFLKALKPRGIVVFQEASAVGWTAVAENWKGFHILRLEDDDPAYIDDDWAPSRTWRTIRLVARKE